MIDFSFPLEELEFYLLILTRVTCFVFAAPFFSMNNVPARVRIGFSLFLAFLLYNISYPHVYPEYTTLLGYAIIVIKEAICGLLLALGTQFCMLIVSFAGHIVDVEVGFSMASTMDPMTKQQVTVSGMLYQYGFMLIFIASGMYKYLLQALNDSFILIPVGQQQFILYDIYNTLVSFMCDYIVVGFRIALPVFCTILILNGTLGIMAKVSPQMNMFAVGLQLKVLAGLGVMFLTVGMLPTAADFIFEQMKVMVVSFVKAMGGGA